MATTIKYVGTEPRFAGYGIINGATELFQGTTFNVRDDVVESYTCQPSLFEVVDAEAPAPTAVPVTPDAEASGELSEVEKEIADLEARKAALETQEAK